jgi:co-chaperonin GroES (HSP10)
MAGFRPSHDRVLMRGLELEVKTPGGIIIPNTAKEKPVEGRCRPSGKARAMRQAKSFRLMSNRAIKFFSEKGRVLT